MKIISALLLALALPLTAAAQAPADTATTYKHQLGLTASPVLDGFFRNNRSLPLGVLYKRQTAPNRALRLGAVGSYRYTDRYDPAPLSNRDYTDRFLSVEGYAGYEFQKALTRRWVGYAGLDVGVGYALSRLQEYSEYQSIVNGVNTTFSLDDVSRFRNYSLFVRPLLGVRYHLRPFLYLSAEATLPVQYTHSKWNGIGTRTFRDTGVLAATDEGRFQEHRIYLGLRPVSQLSLHYLFGRL
jgi:hypothetical protein